MNEPGEIVGMVDVLKLTYATLEQINTMSTGDGEGPAWGKFWLSLDNDSESMMSGEGTSHRPHTPGHRSLMTPDLTQPPVERVDSVQPGESASHHGDESLSASPEPTSAGLEDSPFPFKFKTPSGRVHRFHVIASAGVGDFVANVTAKLGGEVEAVGGEAVIENGKLVSGFALSYLDNEGDTVSITTDGDLIDAITLSRQHHQEKVDLFVHDPEKPPIPATMNPKPPLHKPLTPPPSHLKGRRRHLNDEDDEDDMATPIKKERRPVTQSKNADEQVVPGVPNEMLLPGAIGALAMVIIGVFVISRATSRS